MPKNKKWLEITADNMYSIFSLSLKLFVIVFLMGGAIASMLIVIEEYPKHYDTIYSFISISNMMAYIAMATAIGWIIFSFLNLIFYYKNKKEVK